MERSLRLFGAVLICAVVAGCASAPDLALTERLELPGTGYVMDYPAGWRMDGLEPLGVAVVSEEEVAVADGMIGVGSTYWAAPTAVARSFQVWFQLMFSHSASMQAARFLGDGNITSTARGSVHLAKLYGWEEPNDDAIRDVTVAGLQAAVAEFGPPPSAALVYAAVLPNKDVCILRLLARSTEDLDRFKPTWEKMLASIRPASQK